MSVAVVFDSAGTLLKTVRSVTNLSDNRTPLTGAETTTLTFQDKDRVLILLNASSSKLLNADPAKNLSDCINENNIGFKISCASKPVDQKDIEKILRTDKTCKLSDIRNVIDSCRKTVSKESPVFAMNVGLIVNTRTSKPEFAIASAGYPFHGVKEMISKLHEKGAAVYIASGDRTSKLEAVAEKLAIPKNRVHGEATPEIKAEIISFLKTKYDTTVMVGDGINDLAAMKVADISVLTVQQSGTRPEILCSVADYIVNDITKVCEIIAELN